MRTNKQWQRIWSVAALVGLMWCALTPSVGAWGWSNWWKPSKDIVERLEADGRFTTLLTALELAGLKDDLADAEAATLFAPTDNAFQALPPGALDSLVANPQALAQVLLYHVVGGKQSASELLEASTAVTLQGNPVLVLREGYTVKVNGNRVLNANVWASNGLIHVLDGVLLPPSNPIEINSIVDVLKLDGRFTTLLAAVEAAGLADALAGPGPLTLFAPTDDAFKALPEGLLEGLVANPDLLKSVWLYHVVAGDQSVKELAATGKVQTLQGQTVWVRQWFGRFYVNRSLILEADLGASNGKVQVINRVLVPNLKP